MSCRCSTRIGDKRHYTIYILDYNKKSYVISEEDLLDKALNTNHFDISSAVEDVEFTIRQQIKARRPIVIKKENFNSNYYSVIAHLLSEKKLEDCKI